MKNFILTLICLIAAVALKAQSSHEFKCATTENLQKQKDADPGLESRMLLYEEQIRSEINATINESPELCEDFSSVEECIDFWNKLALGP